MNQPYPVVSVIMATFNRAHFIVETIDSIKQQTFKNWECLIIDDGSSEETEEILKTILLEDGRFKYYKRPENYKKGLPGSRNYGLDLAKGSYIIFFDDDDVVHPLNLEICLSVFNIDSNFSFCNYLKQSYDDNFDYDIINWDYEFNSKQTDSNLLKNMITQKIPFASCTVMWRKECFTNINFNENLMYAEEWECYQRILSTKVKGVLIDKILYFNRKHAQSNTSEFWRNAPLRVNSKKKAIELVVSNLNEKELLTPHLFKYLANFAISFRDFKLVKNILRIVNPKAKLKLFYILKYYLYPVWVYYMNKIKHKD